MHQVQVNAVRDRDFARPRKIMGWGFVTCGPNEALVISGCCYARPHLVPGGRAFVWPVIQQFQKVSLQLMTVQILSKKVVTKLGVPISVVGTAQKAEAEMSYDLQAAKTRQRIKDEEMQVKVIERMQDINVQEQEIQRKLKELEATIKRPAEAEKYRLEKIAEANQKRCVLEAEAKAEAIRLKGDAEAFAIEARAKAEAEQMAKKADAWKEYKEAAMVEMMLETLPKVAAEIAAPLAQTKKLTMVSSGGGEVGAAKITGEVIEIMSRLPILVKQMTGVDMNKFTRKSKVDQHIVPSAVNPASKNKH
ncbi:unnamed protein product [Notodromas monacha]|uniref:Flotillin C-terminal domain-containing protein n=1 Tax=Notodromas monacha TaxID=399045 RepID=A0A7R9C0J7_9CRUS|nr:unnamed protein product [Notodromas monacha]CAG0924255.1 unnamed protein product [Notodromas monacha]